MTADRLCCRIVLVTTSGPRLANRPGMAGTVPELAYGVPCPGRGSFCPGIVKMYQCYRLYDFILLTLSKDNENHEFNFTVRGNAATPMPSSVSE
jgi:hypothetical protein